MLKSLAVLGVLVGASTTAHALKPAVHADLSETACLAQHLAPAFCKRIATEDYNTDAREWDDLRAHAQIDDGETTCEAADGTAQRLYELGGDLRASLAALKAFPTEDKVGASAALIGRALHTIQDNCAHHGMPNPQHAWYSIGDFCDGTATSPDVQADAVACARSETKAVMAIVANTLRAEGVTGVLGWACPAEHTGGDGGTNQRTVCDNRALPAPWDACEFLGEAKEWDGIDRQWNNARVVPALRAELAAGLAGYRASAGLCGGDASAVAAPVSEPVVDVRGGAPSCNRVHLMCFGSADTDDSPFADDPVEDDDGGGCSTSGGSPGALALLLGALVAIRRRR